MIAWFLLLSACTRLKTDSELAVEAFHAAAEEDPAAWALCATLKDPELAGECQVSAIGVKQLDDGEEWRCKDITDARWLAECYFVYAEDRATRQDLTGAIALCNKAGGYGEDCIRHLYRLAVSAHGVDGKNARRLQEEFPGRELATPEELLAARRRNHPEEDPCLADPSAAGCAAAATPDTPTAGAAAWAKASRDLKVKRILCGRAWEGKLPDPAEYAAWPELAWPDTPEAVGEMFQAQAKICADVLKEPKPEVSAGKPGAPDQPDPAAPGKPPGSP